MEFLHQLYMMLRHLSPQSVDAFAHYVGPSLYIVLFAIIFCETGLVVLPFLPGDSLLFAIGAVAASSSSISLPKVAVLLCIAANCGDVVNYLIGYRLGPKVFSKESSRLLNKKHLLEAQQFYERHGRKTIIIARFVPIIRTFAPFVAGIGRMNFVRFAIFSVTGGVIWVLTCLLAGYRLAKFEIIQKHFEIVVLAIIAVSLVPVVISFLNSRRATAAAVVKEDSMTVK
jgi:membrane-associated protein